MIPNRIVSLCPSNTEILFALGAGNSVVGVDSYSDHPPEVKLLPKVGPDLRVSIQKIKALNPDLVIASLSVPGMERNIEGLERENLPFLVLNPLSIEDILEDIKRLGCITKKVENADIIVGDIKETIEALKSQTKTLKVKPTLYWEWWPKPYIVACRNSWVNDMSEIVGGVNLFSDIHETSSEFDEDDIIERNPDILLICWCGERMQSKMNIDEILSRPGWENIKGVAIKSIHCIPESLFGRPGPRVKEGLMLLSKIVHPEIFK